MQNVIKTKFRNRLNIKHLESVLRMDVEGPSNDFDHIFMIATIELW